ncbi:leucine-rich repeat domain-containing protein [Muricoprocola aceti]|uniref:leucine-rich repeat domain-containing protein n=1 Tax=Muricoprocola aceti TaxID=2981772 RepID=UPI00293F73C0|nr:leucine-rich repeat domain-containing protein [Muricoprocola aceti]
MRRRFTSCTQNSLFSYQIQRNKVTGISTNAFKNNTVLKTVAIGKNVTVIGANAFYGCKKLSKVSGGNSIVKIGGRAFANCVSLNGITIAGTVKSIGKQAFYNCKKLRTITFKTSALSSKTIGTKAFTGTYLKPTVRVPAKKLNAYKKLLKSKGMSGKAIYKK